MNQKGKKEMKLILKVKGNCLQKQSNQGNFYDNYIDVVVLLFKHFFINGGPLAPNKPNGLIKTKFLNRYNANTPL